ncbi:MAG: tripartite tricarboxylate transporter TctB family protein [Acidobacteria bacterium]|nr:tripartite tricarboxylate transporter TctB family protein [Acidobacteriota bacterium]
MRLRFPHPGEMFISLGLVALGAYVLIDTQSISETQNYSHVGPRLFPHIVGNGLILLGSVLAAQALPKGWHNVPLDRDATNAPDFQAAGMITIAVLLHMALIGMAGFIISGILLFTLVARAFGSRRPVVDLGIAAVLVSVVYFIFSYALGLELPNGPLGAF